MAFSSQHKYKKISLEYYIFIYNNNSSPDRHFFTKERLKLIKHVFQIIVKNQFKWRNRSLWRWLRCKRHGIGILFNQLKREKFTTTRNFNSMGRSVFRSSRSEIERNFWWLVSKNVLLSMEPLLPITLRRKTVDPNISETCFWESF